MGIPNYLNIIGLLFDIFGAILVSSEVVNQFRGKEVDVHGGIASTDGFGHGKGDPPVSVGQQVEETAIYKRWKEKKYFKMKAGLILLIVGFTFQIGSNCYPSSFGN